MGSYSKNKGKSWERDVCKFLETRLGGKFIRSPSSGAIIGGKNSKLKEYISEGAIRTFKGDIIPPQEYPFLVIEAKNYGNFPFHSVYKNSSQLNAWIDQMNESLDPRDLGLLIIKITRKGSWALFKEKDLGTLTDSNFMVYNYLGEKYILSDLELLFKEKEELIRQKSS